MDKFYENLRKKIVDVDKKAIKLVKLVGLDECLDSNCYVNCRGLGRIRKYKEFRLFLDNMGGTQKKLFRGVDPTTDVFETQVFQILGCNMKCWYCFVDDCVLTARTEYAEWITVNEMINLFIEESNEPYIIDLSGGQPDLAPEWCLWVMEEIEKRKLKDKVYIWLDDNLTTTHVMEKYLSYEQILYMANYPKHSRACCFKGYNESTYQFNVRNNCMSLKDQISNFRKLYEYGFDVYAYITLTGTKGSANKSDIELFIDKIQDIHPRLPLRLIPLKINQFEATSRRMKEDYFDALHEQYRAYDIWKSIMEERYTKEELSMSYEDVILH